MLALVFVQESRPVSERQLSIRLDFAQVGWARTAWLESGNTVLAGSASESDCIADTLVPVLVDSKSAANSEALVSVVLVPAGAPGGESDLLDLLWHNITVESMFSLHSVDVHRVHAGIWFDLGQLGSAGVRVHTVVVVLLGPSVDVFEILDIFWSLHIVNCVKVIQVDVFVMVVLVSGSLRLGGDARRGIFVVTGI